MTLLLNKSGCPSATSLEEVGELLRVIRSKVFRLSHLAWGEASGISYAAWRHWERGHYLNVVWKDIDKISSLGKKLELDVGPYVDRLKFLLKKKGFPDGPEYFIEKLQNAKSFSEALKAVREHQDITFDEIADAMPVSRTTIYIWENNKRSKLPTLAQFEILIEVLLPYPEKLTRENRELILNLETKLREMYVAENVKNQPTKRISVDTCSDMYDDSWARQILEISKERDKFISISR